jgi:hypothetical protein
LNKSRKYLRFRTAGEGGNENRSSADFAPVAEKFPENAAKHASDAYHATDKFVTVYQKESQLASDDASSGSRGAHSDPSPLSSKVLLSEGRVLLNPLLADLRTGSHPKRDTETDTDTDTEAHPSDVLSRRTDRAIIPSSSNMFSHEQAASGGDKHGGASGASKLLTMMIPASSIQWGFEWRDETSPDNSEVVMKHLLKNFNLSTYDLSRSEDDTQSDEFDMSKLWLEIGCNVLDAKLVQSIA